MTLLLWETQDTIRSCSRYYFIREVTKNNIIKVE